MKWQWRGSLVALAASTSVAAGFAADDPKKADPPKTPGNEQKSDDKKDSPSPALEKFLEAKKALAEEQKKFQKIINEAREQKRELSLKDPEIGKGYKAQMDAMNKTVEAALLLAKEQPKSKDGADALVMVAQQEMPGSKTSREVMALLLEHHIDRDEIGRLIMNYSYMPMSEDLQKNLMAVEEKSKNKSNVLAAKVTRGKMLLKDKTKAEEGEKLLVKILAESKSETLFGRPIDKMLEGDLFEYRNLSIGKTVPEIDGVDFDGKNFKISDYRGKVVMLDFWGHW